jgi:GT2 family glycosyltransferase
MSEPRVSVVVPTFHRPERLERCLEALARQTMPHGTFEVVVVDDGSPEPIRPMGRRFAGRLEVRVLRQANAGPAAARNHGVRAARAPLVAFTDDDCAPRPDWLERLLDLARERPGMLLGGRTFNGLPGDLLADTSQLIVDLVYAHFNVDPEDAYFFASNNLLVPRDRMIALGGFDEGFPRAGAEDRDFCNRWRAAGFRLVSCPEAGIDHFHAQSLGTFLDLHQRYGRGAYLYQAKRRERGTGTMREDLGFHRTLLRHVWDRLGSRIAWDRAVPVAFALCLWQVANAVGFFREAGESSRSQPRESGRPVPVTLQARATGSRRGARVRPRAAGE